MTSIRADDGVRLDGREHDLVLPLEDDGHAANIEQPNAFNRVMLEFLERTDARTA